MEKNIEFVLKKLSKSNIKQVERDTGIPASRIYKWLKKKGNPKANDLEIMLNYFQKEEKLFGNENVTHTENINQRLINLGQNKSKNVLYNPDVIKSKESGVNEVRSKDEVYNDLELIIDSQQEQILQLLTSTRILKDQLMLLKTQSG